MTFGNNITKDNCYDYHNDNHYCSPGGVHRRLGICVLLKKVNNETPCNDR